MKKRKLLLYAFVAIALCASVYFLGWAIAALAPVVFGGFVATSKTRDIDADAEKAADSAGVDAGSAAAGEAKKDWHTVKSKKIPPLLIVLLFCIPGNVRAECVASGPLQVAAGLWPDDATGLNLWCTCPVLADVSKGSVTRMPQKCEAPAAGLLIQVDDYATLIGERQTYFTQRKEWVRIASERKNTILSLKTENARERRDHANALANERSSGTLSKILWFAGGVGLGYLGGKLLPW